MHDLWTFLDALLGLDADPQHLSLGQVTVRAAFIYLAALAMLRIGETRFLGKNAAFDVVLGFILGAILSRAINGNAPFFETLGGAGVLLGLHWIFSTAAFYSDRLNVLLSGEDVQVIREGQVQWDQMRDKRISRRMLMENLRANGYPAEPSAVQETYFERNGDFSIVPKKEPEVLEVRIEEGVQIVRIQLE